MLAQTYPHYYIYVCDDGSTDETSLLLKEYSHHPQLKVVSQPNAGVSSARNKAVAQGDSPWIAFLDSDDFWYPTKCQEFVEKINLDPAFSFIHCDEEWIKNETSVPIPSKFCKNSEIDPLSFFEKSLHYTLISTSTVMLKRGLFEELGGFQTQLKICEDYDLWNKILLSQKIYFLEKTLVKKYGGHTDQLSMTDPCLDFYRVKSLAMLLEMPKLSNHVKEIIEDVFKQKTSRLLETLKKHQRSEDLQEIVQLRNRLLL